MGSSPRQRFLAYVKGDGGERPIVSPFLPDPSVVRQCLELLGLPVTDDDVTNEITLAQDLDYEPMFMTEMSSLIFPWQVDECRSTNDFEVSVIQTKKGDWIRHLPHRESSWNEETPGPVQSEADHELLVMVCEQIEVRETEIRAYFRQWRERVGEEGVIVLGHPHPSWLGYQISPQMIFYHWNDYRRTFIRSMEAIYEASLFIMTIAMEAGVDFMSDSSYGLEMTSPELFEAMDLPYIQRFGRWTHERGGLFWYHNCGYTRKLILDGTFNQLEADVIETIAPPPEGDNDLGESRRYLTLAICTKGNFDLHLLRDGSPGQISAATEQMIKTIRDYRHIVSTADAVLPGTPPENFVAFVTAAREAFGS